jgi:hypothetical protein
MKLELYLVETVTYTVTPAENDLFGGVQAKLSGPYNE